MWVGCDKHQLAKPDSLRQKIVNTLEPEDAGLRRARSYPRERSPPYSVMWMRRYEFEADSHASALQR